MILRLKRRTMRCEIDQSGKIEKSNKVTVVAFSNGEVKSLVMSAVEKQKLIRMMRKMDYPKKLFVFKIFAVLIFVLLRDSKVREVYVDKEYPGKEGIIKDVVRGCYKKVDKQMPEIKFREIGKKSGAHKMAIAVFRGKVKADVIVKSIEVIKILYK